MGVLAKFGKYEAYPPSEDTFLLYDSLKDIKGYLIEVGAGSGYISINLSFRRKVRRVYALEKDEDSLKVLEYNKIINKALKVSVRKSDLFKNLKLFLKADFIIFNPPYLPELEIEDGKTKIWVSGGKKGWETINRFFKRCSKFLKKNGKIYIVFSSRTSKDKIYRVLRSKNYRFRIVNKKSFFFEKLYVLKIWRSKRGSILMFF